MTSRLLLCLMVLAAGCASTAENETVLVLAAASLTDAFSEIEVAFEADNPTIDVQLSFAGSSALREQIVQGVPADVFASANDTTMAVIVGAGETASHPVIFARNALQIAVPAGNPAGVAGLEAFADGQLLLGICAVGVPCGDAAREALSRAGVTPSVDTNESDVRSLVTKLAADELDAGIVYATDVQAEPAVDGIDLPSEVNVEVAYPIATLAAAPNAAAAEAFVAFVRSPTGQQILLAAGFLAP